MDELQRIGDDARTAQNAIDDSFPLKKHHPGRGTDQHRSPERQQHENHQQIAEASRYRREQVRDRVSQHKADQGHDGADPESPFEHIDENRLLRRRSSDAAVRRQAPIERGQQVETRIGSGRMLQRRPGLTLAPARIDPDQLVESRGSCFVANLPGSAEYQGSKAVDVVIETVGDCA